MLTLTQIEQIAQEVQSFINLAITGNAPKDLIAAIASSGSAALLKGTDPAADIAALAAVNTFFGDLVTARKQVVAAGAQPIIAPQ